MKETTIKKLLLRATKNKPKSVIVIRGAKYLETHQGVYRLTKGGSFIEKVPYVGW